MCLFKIEEYLETKYGIKRKQANTNKQELIVETADLAQHRELLHMTNVLNVKCEVTHHRSFNSTKGLIYVTHFDVADEESFKQGLQEEYNISEMLSAKWIKLRDQNSQAFLLTFNQTKIPEFTLLKIFVKSTGNSITYPVNNVLK